MQQRGEVAPSAGLGAGARAGVRSVMQLGVLPGRGRCVGCWGGERVHVYSWPKLRCCRRSSLRGQDAVFG